jgi:hypothetical protein
VRAKQRASVLVEQRAARDRTEACHDARALAIELARGEPSARFDPMRAGVVLQQAEKVYRQAPIWVRVQQDGRWADASSADILVIDMRLLCRFASGRLTSLWWNGVVGLHIDLATEDIVLDFGDGQPVNLTGQRLAPIAVVAIASVYGTEAILTHHALAPLRTTSVPTHRGLLGHG